VLAALFAAALSACGADPAGRPTATIRLATTTSARDTGLLDVLLPAFRKETNIEVQPIAVGTGEALKYGERGDADVVIVHARNAEDAFMAKGFGVERRDIWWNRFLVVGPPSADPDAETTLGLLTLATNLPRAHPVIGHDPSSTPEVPSVRIQAFLHFVAAHGWTFVSRGDDSGTDKREKELWGKDFRRWPGYLETGQGMGPTLTIADEKNAYCLTDEGTFLRMRKGLRLEVVLADDPALANPYGAILVKAPDATAAKAVAARRFFDWLGTEPCRALVRGLVIEGHRVFFLPGETPTDPLRGRLDPK
jgi:tungstate transport system substrate-binding protein